jgi:hypothetical protein
MYKEQTKRSTRGILPRFGPHGCVKPYSYFSLLVVLSSKLQERL